MKRFWLLTGVVALALGLGLWLRAKPPAQRPIDALAQQLRERLSRAAPKATVVSTSDGKYEVHVGLLVAPLPEELLLERCAKPGPDCEAAFDALVAQISAEAGPPEPTLPLTSAECLLATLGTTRMVEDTVASMTSAADGGKVEQPLYEPFVGELVMLFVCERGGKAPWLTTEDLDFLEMTRDEVRERALQNLDARLKTLAFHPLGTAGAVSTNAQPDAYAAALVLIDSVWKDFEAQEKSALVVGVPARGRIFVGPAQPRVIAELRQAVHEGVTKEERPLTEQLLLRRGGQWAVLPPDGGLAP